MLITVPGQSCKKNNKKHCTGMYDNSGIITDYIPHHSSY